MCSCRPLLFFWRHLAVHSTKRRYICGQSFRNNYGTTSCGRMNGKKMSWKRKLFSQECGLHNCFPIISFFVNDYIYRKTGANKLCWQDNNLTYIFSKHFILFFCKWPGHICLVVLFLRSFLTSVFFFSRSIAFVPHMLIVYTTLRHKWALRQLFLSYVDDLISIWFNSFYIQFKNFSKISIVAYSGHFLLRGLIKVIA